MKSGFYRMLILWILAAHTAFCLVHPGGLHTEDDLQLIRSKVAAGAEPWSSAWVALRSFGAGTGYNPNVTATVNDVYAMQIQGHAAMILAIKWVASGDMAYATACKRVINGWVNTVKTINVDPLRTGIGGNQMANAAEIMAHGFNGAAGWPDAEVSRAKVWFQNVVYPKVRVGASSNWGTAGLSGCMAIAVFCDNQSMFDFSVNVYKDGFPGGHCNIAVDNYIWSPTGQTTEAGRDQAHAQFGVANLVYTARMAWVQGVNIVTFADNRLVAGMEYLGKYNLGESVPYDANFPDVCNVHPNWPAISTLQRGWYYPVWEAADRLFNDAGIPHPYTTRVVGSSGQIYKPEGRAGGAYRPERSMNDAVGQGTLMYAGITRPGGPISSSSLAPLDGTDPRPIPGLRMERGSMTLTWAENPGKVFGLSGRAFRSSLMPHTGPGSQP